MIKKAKKVGESYIRNSTKVEVDSIKFRSKLEAFAYKRFKEEGLDFEYEAHTYTIIEKFEYMGEKLRAATLTPDFINQDKRIIIECKGWETPISAMKRKLLKRVFHLAREDWDIYIVKSQKQVNELINKLKNV